jgi:hypothetical protein
VREWGKSGFGLTDFRLPHGITLRGDRLLISDRENGRVAIYDTTGTLQHMVAPLAGVLVYAATFDVDGGMLLAVRGESSGGVLRLNPQGMLTVGFGKTPVGAGETLAVHDIAVGSDGAVYVAETAAGGLRKFARFAEAR